jgi:hypothetical protein
VIADLLGLRQALDQAIAAVQAVEPAVAAWQASWGSVLERAEASAGTPAPLNGSAAPDGPVSTPAEPSRRKPGRRPLPPEEREARRQAAAERARAKRRSRQLAVPGREQAVHVAGRSRARPPSPDLAPLPDLAPVERPFDAHRPPEDPERAQLLAAAAPDP